MDVRTQPDTYNTMHIGSGLLAPLSNSRIAHIRHEHGSDMASQLYMQGDNYESQNWLYRDRSATEAIYASDSCEYGMRERKLDECLRSAHAQAQDGRRARKCEGNVVWHVPKARASGRSRWWWPPFILTVGPFPLNLYKKWKLVDEGTSFLGSTFADKLRRYFLFWQ